MAESGWDEQFDFIVVGSGGGGMVAALAAAESSEKVLLLESTDKFGGSTGMSGGILWVPNNPLQAGDGVEDSRDAGAAYLDALTPNDPTPLAAERREAFLDTAPQVVNFMLRKGIPLKRCEGWSDYHDELPGGCARGRSVIADNFDLRELGDKADKLRVGNFPLPVTWPGPRDLALIRRTFRGFMAGVKLSAYVAWMKIRGARLVSMGAALQGRMLKLIYATRGIDLRTEAPVVDLVKEGERVMGVIAQIGGKQTRIRASRGVLICSGGFARNQDMRDEYMPKPTHDDWSHTNAGDLGGPIAMAMEKGAQSYFDGNAIWLVSSRNPDGSKVFHLNDLAKPHCIMVDRQGRRFSDESGSYMQNGLNMYAAGAVPAWVVLDSRHRSRYPWGIMLPGKTPDALIASGYMKKAETLEDLARQCGIDANGLKQGVDRFNGFARTGVDEDFQRGANSYDKVFGDPSVKPNPCLGTIEKAPFYAIEVFPGDVGTVGGLVVDRHARVVDGQGTPIPGLYAAGNCAAPIFGRTYPGAGASIAGTCTFGYLAARHAMGANDAHA
ncbi:hypothetical protein JI59_08515 [Novosphingobium pentaromativorans US6-1]|nr:FAD-binding protein [Novosphingobium pentaromativorans]AIT79817.1 hypothetical protein JI59_08515 [Novosphingobium pentaromativorans US6-1]